MKRFQDLLVVESAGSLAGGYCAKLFADHGAEVVVIGERDLPAPQVRYLDAAKRSVGPGSDAGSADSMTGSMTDAMADLLDRADVVIESSAVEPLVPLTVPRDEIVHVQISPYGSTGPYAQWRGADIADYALGGHLYLYGDPEREPIMGPPNQPRYASGLMGFVGAMAALMVRRRTGVGQRVEVSHVETMAALHQFTMLRYTLGRGNILKRMGNRFTGQGQPNSIYPCADGWVCVSAPAADQVERLLDITELSHLLDRPDITSPLDFQVLPHVLDDALGPWLAERDTADIVELLQAVRVPAAPVSTMDQLLADPQLADRGYWRGADGGADREASPRVPGPPFRMSRHPWRGEGKVVDGPDGQASEQVASPEWDAPTMSLSAVEEGGPLAGVKVLDLTRVWAGPLAARIMAELGADVVMVEAPWGRGPLRMPDSMVETVKYFPDNDQGDEQWNRNGHFTKFSIGKRSLALDLAADDGVPTFEKLVPWADVVIENYSSRVMPQFGLDEHRLHELNPSLVYVTMPGYGRSGPAEHWLAFGSSVDSHAGLSSLIGYPDQRPWKGGIAWPDPIAGLHATGAMLMALWDREADPQHRGQTIESAQFEATVAAVGDQLLAAQLGEVPEGSSNRSTEMAPQGVYRCAGDDRWLAISITGDDDWQALCSMIGMEQAEGYSLADRLEQHDEIDAVITEWTTSRDQRSAAAEFQARGIVAAPVLDAQGVVEDPHFGDRSLFVDFDQPGMGPFTTPGIPLRLSETPARVRRRSPRLGEHNAEVLRDIGGLDEAEIERLMAEGVIANRPPA